MKKLMIIAGLMALCLGAAAQEKIYSVKSGKVTMEMDMMGQKIVQQNYFDDYGVKQATVMEMMGQKMRSIEVDGKTYTQNVLPRCVFEGKKSVSITVNMG